MSHEPERDIINELTKVQILLAENGYTQSAHLIKQITEHLFEPNEVRLLLEGVKRTKEMLKQIQIRE